MRILNCSCLAWIICLSACASSDPNVTGVGASGSGPSNVSGSPGSAGSAAPSGGSGSPAGGAPSTSPGGAGSVAGAFVKPMGTGGGDEGDLFDPGSAVPLDPAGGSGGSVGTGGSGGLNTDGVTATSHINQIGSVNGTAVFTQHGADVEVKVTLTKCPDGVLGLHINSGDSCDNAGAEKLPWDGKRGNIGDSGTITCKNNSASLDYTRVGTDPTTNWTVGDHNFKTDVTPYVVIVATKADGTSGFVGCGNFFSS